MEKEPSRLLYPKEHRKWAESIADAKAAEMCKQLNAQLHDATVMWKAARNKALIELKTKLTNETGTTDAEISFHIKQVEEVINERDEMIFENIKAINKEDVAEYRAEVLKSFGY